MKDKKYRRVHKKLHNSLDSLVIDFLIENPEKKPSNTSVKQLIKWSWQQWQEPTEEQGV